jgi:RNA-directed DNA polymerase
MYAKAKSEPSWRFWGLFVHVCKVETLHEAYRMARRKDGAPGVDGVTFADIEAGGVEEFLGQLRAELVSRKYVPLPNRRKEIPKDGGKKVRVLGIPSIRDRVVQGALQLILEPIFEAGFQSGSFGYRPGRRPYEAVEQVRQAISEGKLRVIDLDLKAYFDNVKHHIVLAKVAKRVQDQDVLWLLKLIMKATGSKGVPQGGVISPLLSNIYLDEVDRMLERAREVTRTGRWTRVQYARFADDLVVLVDGRPEYDRLFGQVSRRLREELALLEIEVNEEKTKSVDLGKRESFDFLGFQIRRVRSQQGKWFPLCRPLVKKRTELVRKLKVIFRAHQSQPVGRVIVEINPILRGWVNYFARGHSSQCFSFVRQWVEKKVRRHLARNSKRHGFGWKRWSTRWLYTHLGLFDSYRVQWKQPLQKALPAG